MLPPNSTTWQSLVGGDSLLYTMQTFTKTGLVTGGNYEFRVRASNSFGWGPFSSIVTIKADDVPA